MLPKTLPYDNNISLVEKNKKKEPKSYAAPNASEASSSQVNSKSRQLQAKNTIINSMYSPIISSRSIDINEIRYIKNNWKSNRVKTTCDERCNFF